MQRDVLTMTEGRAPCTPLGIELGIAVLANELTVLC